MATPGGHRNSLFPDGDDESVEEAVEADERLVFDPANADPEDAEGEEEVAAGDVSDGALADDPGLPLHYWLAAALPLLLVLLIQLLPLPGWALGFVTGVVVAAPAAVYGMYVGFVKDAAGAGTKFIDNVRKRVPKRPAIIVQEELERKYVRNAVHGLLNMER